MTKILTNEVAVCGSVRTKGVAHLVSCPQGQPFSIAIIRDIVNAKWVRSGDDPLVDWTAVSCDCVTHPQSQAVIIGPYGQVVVDGKGDFHQEIIRNQEGPTERRGKMLRVRCIGAKAYAVGMGRQVYRRDDVNTWTPIDQGCLFVNLQPLSKNGPSLVEELKASLCGFFGIDGFSENDIYAAGVHGEIWHFNGKKWKQLDSPTNVNFNDVICGDDGFVYICADDGVLVRGREDNWSVFSDPAFTDTIYNLAWFEQRLYLANLQGVFARDDKGKIKPVKWGKDKPGTTYHLSARDGIMWSIGAKDIMQFNGKAWSRVDP